MTENSELTEFAWADEEPGYWLLPLGAPVRPEDQLCPEELDLLRNVVARRRPQSLPLLDIINRVALRPSEREQIRALLLDDLHEYGVVQYGEWNGYGEQLDKLDLRLTKV